jgi:hypothetical protein
MRELGIDVVSLYIPWRLHELPRTSDGINFDFTGRTHPQRDLIRFMRNAAALDMMILPKPGPYIHAEVQYGGLPDRVMRHSHPYTAADGKHLTAYGCPLPSFCPGTPFVKEAQSWLHAVTEQALALMPREAIFAVQIGNEGACGDAALSASLQDHWPGGTHDGAAVVTRAWQWISDAIDLDTPRLVNIPAVAINDHAKPFHAWTKKQAAFRSTGFHCTRTEWVGNPAHDMHALISIVLASIQGPADVSESNWGYTWSDERYLADGSAVFASMLSLTLGASTLSYYPTVATYNWHPAIIEDDDGLRKEGLDPSLRRPPYAPGAPLKEDGTPRATHRSALAFSQFLHRFGHYFLETSLVLPSGAALDTHPIASPRSGASGIGPLSPPGRSSLQFVVNERCLSDAETALNLKSRLLQTWGQDCRLGNGTPDPPMIERISESKRTRIVAVFNPTEHEAPVNAHDIDEVTTWVLPPHTARLAIFDESDLICVFDSTGQSTKWLRPCEPNRTIQRRSANESS